MNSDPFVPSREAVLEAMQSVGREVALREMWGDGFDSLVDYLAFACPPTHIGLDMLRLSIANRPYCRTAVLAGERCSGADIKRGSDSPILLGLVPVMKLLAPVSWMSSEGRTGREPNALSLIFSGGVLNREEMGELPGSVMAEQFNVMTSWVYRSVVEAESLSLNTGDQGRMLAMLLFVRRVERVVFCHVVDHIARFAATVMAALQQLVDAENQRLDALGDRYFHPDHEPIRSRIRAARRKMPEIVFIALSSWNARDPRRGRDNGGDGISRAHEAFRLQTPEEAMMPGRLLGCEYADRYFSRQHRIQSLEFVCPALPPAAMIQLIPPWAQEWMGFDTP